MKAFSMFFGKLPFSGKSGVRSLFSALYQSPSFSERLKKYLILIVVFVFLFWGHGIQMLMGIRIVSIPTIPFWALIIGGVYAIINLTVIVMHLYLIVRATKVLLSRRYSRNKSRTLGNVPQGEALLATVFTLSGQFVFLAVYYVFV